MSRTTLAGAAVAAGLLLPATASAATTYTVDPAAPAGCAGTTCKTITEANAKVADGDTVSIKAGAYQEAPIVVTRGGVTFVAADPGKVAVSTNSATAGASTFVLGDGTAAAGKGTVLRGLVVGGPATGGPAITVRTTGTLLDTLGVQRVGTSDAPAIEYDDSGNGITGGANAIKSSIVFLLQNPAEAGTAPAIDGGAETSLTVDDSTVVSGAKGGAGLRFDGNDRATAAPMAAIPNRVTRGTVLIQNPAANAVEVVTAAASAAPKATVLDSVALAPGSAGAGVAASSLAGNAITGATAGDIAVTATHVSIAGGGKPFALNAAALPAPTLPAPLGTPNPAVGSITLTADRSIAHGAGPSTVTAAATAGTQTGPTARLTIKDSDATDVAGGSGTATTTTSGAITRAADTALFRAPGDLHLRAGAPVIDKGGAQVAGESDKDFEGQARVVGAASDLGADEFSNTLPTAVLKADRTAIKQGETINFDATGSADPDGGIAQYALNFGDGSPAETPASGKASHLYAKAGTYRAILGVADASGGGGIAAVDVTVADASPPVVAITAPKAKAKVTLLSAKTKKTALSPVNGRKRTRTTITRTLRKVLFTGTASDDAGIRTVELSLRRVKVAKVQAKVGRTTKTVTAKAAQATQCTFLDAKTRKFVGKPCGKPVFFTVAVKNGKWSYQLKKGTTFRLGSYELTARATDVNGVVSAPVKAAFTLR